MSNDYWTWWIGGLALAALTILFRLLTSRALGVSGSWYRVAFWRQEQKKDQAAAALDKDKDAVASAMMAAALAEFGEDALDEAVAESAAQDKNAEKAVNKGVTPTPWTVHLVFLLCTFLGAFVWAIFTGSFQIQFELSELHTQLSGTGWKIFFTLFIGGFFVGIGTQMAGGCSSGHGLSGCSNFSVPSMIATAFFFGTAVLVSLSFQAFLS